MPVSPDPIRLVERLFEKARRGSPETESDAMVVATTGQGGRPSARFVLLRGLDRRGFVFYTNTKSRKGREIARRNDVALCIYWSAQNVQVRVEGRAEPLDPAEADAYFRSRPRMSQIGAWASAQSRPLKSRRELLDRVARFSERFAGGQVPRPPGWSGYRVRPARIEIWRGRPDRLHDRDLYVRRGRGWKHSLLYP